MGATGFRPSTSYFCLRNSDYGVTGYEKFSGVVCFVIGACTEVVQGGKQVIFCQPTNSTMGNPMVGWISIQILNPDRKSGNVGNGHIEDGGCCFDATGGVIRIEPDYTPTGRRHTRFHDPK